MNKKIILIFCTSLTLVAGAVSCEGGSSKPEEMAAQSGNPIVPGNFADPAVIFVDSMWYMYSTTGADATVWYSKDFINWKLRNLNWPTSTGIPNQWAPGVVEGKDGKIYLYYTLNSEIYAGVADHPFGPFRNLMPGGQPMIKDKEYFPPEIHSIDADCFIDDDGEIYLYWGSGWDFKDGVCAVGVLNDDMCTFKSAPQDITPSGYFEGPHMFKREGKYYLTYSDGIFTDSTYKVRYAMSDSPLGPFDEAANSPILVSDYSKMTSGPGHHFTVTIGGDMYIVYHKHEWPYYQGFRQICADKLEFDGEGYILPVEPTSTGVADMAWVRPEIVPVSFSASSSRGTDYTADKVGDKSWGTLWLAETSEEGEYLIADFGKKVTVEGVEPVFAEIRENYDYVIEYRASEDAAWVLYATGNNASANEWPIEIDKHVKASQMRLTLNSDSDVRFGLWEWKFYGR